MSSPPSPSSSSRGFNRTGDLKRCRFHPTGHPGGRPASRVPGPEAKANTEDYPKIFKSLVRSGFRAFGLMIVDLPFSRHSFALPGRTGRLPSQNPHRPVRARLTHTVPRVMASLREWCVNNTPSHTRSLTLSSKCSSMRLPSFAIRCCFVYTSMDSKASFCVSQQRPHNLPARPFPTPAPHGSGSPLSLVL